MNFDEAMKAAAKTANAATSLVMHDYRAGNITDEDDITPALVGSLRNAFDGQIGGLIWNASIVRHRKGHAAEERRTGADIVFHVSLQTPTQKYSKGVLIQAKRFDKFEQMTPRQHAELLTQCGRMLQITPEAFVFDYLHGSLRCGSAVRIIGAASPNLYSLCGWTSYRFFLELFRCPVGDPKLTSSLVRDLPVPNVLTLVGSGQISEDKIL